MMKQSLGEAYDSRNNKLGKTVTLSTGLSWYDLEAPAKNLYPTITPLRNSIPRNSRGKPGTAAHWVQVSAIIGSGFDAMGWVPEGQRSGTMSYVTSPMAASYVTMGEEDSLTFEAESAAEGFEDENAMVTFRLLQKTMRKEEIGILGGNASLALGVPGTPTGTGNTGTGGTLPATNYYFKVVALTLEGWKNSSLANGVATTKTITGADGKNYLLYGGSSNISAEVASAVTVSSGCSLVMTEPTPVQGAVAYAWFVGTTSGGETLQLITNIACGVLSVPLVTGRQPQSSITQDCSRNPGLAWDGLLSCALNSNAPFYPSATTAQAYVNYLPNATNGLGSFLTASGRGSIVEIDNMLQTMWNTYNLGPTVLYVNAQEQKNITNAALSNTAGPLLRYDAPADGKNPYAMVAGGVVEWYYNPFAMDGGTKIPVKLHPDVPPGTIVGWCERLPVWYQSNEVPNVAEMLIRREYHRIDWPLRTRQREYGIYLQAVLAVYATFGMGVISNIGNNFNT
jgi:hypothetical protein